MMSWFDASVVKFESLSLKGKDIGHAMLLMQINTNGKNTGSFSYQSINQERHVMYKPCICMLATPRQFKCKPLIFEKTFIS